MTNFATGVLHHFKRAIERLLCNSWEGPSEQSPPPPQLLLGGDSSLGYFKQSMLEKPIFVSEVSNKEYHLFLLTPDNILREHRRHSYGRSSGYPSSQEKQLLQKSCKILAINTTFAKFL